MIYSKDATAINTPYAKNGTVPAAVYDKSGSAVWQNQSTTHKVSNSFTESEICVVTGSTYGSGTQGLACDSLSQEIAQMYTGKIITISTDDGSYALRASVFNLGHGSTAQFAPEKLSESDPYPLLYVSTGSNTTLDDNRYGVLLEVKLGESSSTMRRVFYLPIDTATYGMTAIDFEHGIAYHVTRAKFEPDSGETIDYTYVYAYDMATYETWQGTTYNPRPSSGSYVFTHLLDKFTVPYISEMQSISFFDGLIACLSDARGVVFIDVNTHEVYLTIPKSRIMQDEREGIGFMYNPETEQTDMIVSARYSGTHYHRFQFNLT